MDSQSDPLLSPDNLAKLRLDQSQANHREKPPRKIPPTDRKRRIKGQFLKGPISMAWFAVASKLPGKALAVALAIRFESGRTKDSPTVKLTNHLVGKLGVSRKAKYSAIDALEGAGLILVDREPRKTAMVTIVELPDVP